MGCFDSVFVGCPECKEPLEFQSKSGPCEMVCYMSHEVPADVAKYLIGAEEKCSCGAVVKLKLAKPMPDVELVVDIAGEDTRCG